MAIWPNHVIHTIDTQHKRWGRCRLPITWMFRGINTWWVWWVWISSFQYQIPPQRNPGRMHWNYAFWDSNLGIPFAQSFYGIMWQTRPKKIDLAWFTRPISAKIRYGLRMVLQHWNTTRKHTGLRVLISLQVRFDLSRFASSSSCVPKRTKKTRQSSLVVDA